MFHYICKINRTRVKVYLLKLSRLPNSYEDIVDAETLGAMWLTSIPFLWRGFQTHSCCQGSPS